MHPDKCQCGLCKDRCDFKVVINFITTKIINSFGKIDETTLGNIQSNFSTAVIILTWIPHSCKLNYNERFSQNFCPPTKRRKMSAKHTTVKQTVGGQLLSSSDSNLFTKDALIKANLAALKQREPPSRILAPKKRFSMCANTAATRSFDQIIGNEQNQYATLVDRLEKMVLYQDPESEIILHTIPSTVADQTYIGEPYEVFVACTIVTGAEKRMRRWKKTYPGVFSPNLIAHDTTYLQKQHEPYNGEIDFFVTKLPGEKTLPVAASGHFRKECTGTWVSSLHDYLQVIKEDEGALDFDWRTTFISDDMKGICNAISICFGDKFEDEALMVGRLLCLFHKLENLKKHKFTVSIFPHLFVVC